MSPKPAVTRWGISGHQVYWDFKDSNWSEIMSKF